MLNKDSWHEWMRQDIERYNEQMKKINAPPHWYQDADTLIAECDRKTAERITAESCCQKYGINFHNREEVSWQNKFAEVDEKVQTAKYKLLLEYYHDLEDKVERLEARVAALEKKLGS